MTSVADQDADPEPGEPTRIVQRPGKRVDEDAQAAVAAGDFLRALSIAEEATQAGSLSGRIAIAKANALVGLNRPAEALGVIAHVLATAPDDLAALRAGRDIAMQSGRFRLSVDYSLKLLELQPHDQKNKRNLLLNLIAGRDPARAREYAGRFRDAGAPPTVLQAILSVEKIALDKALNPMMNEIWEGCLGAGNLPPLVAEPEIHTSVPDVIQYWSQGAPPPDVAIISAKWQEISDKLALGKIKWFNRHSAEIWISENAPSFSRPFAQSFHYSMESDIFRVAYASQRHCLYLDADTWPLEHAAPTIRRSLEQRSSLLHIRYSRAWINGDLFLNTPGCPFFAELTRQCLTLDLASLPKNQHTLMSSFGPSRLNNALRQAISDHSDARPFVVDDIFGMAALRGNTLRLMFSHDAAVASMQPPMRLKYKNTQLNWKNSVSTS